MVGGWDGQGVVKTVERFNPQEGNWKKVSHHPEIRYGSLPLRGGRVGWSGGGEDSRKIQPSFKVPHSRACCNQLVSSDFFCKLL